jgi:hypothetical protein
MSLAESELEKALWGGTDFFKFFIRELAERAGFEPAGGY